MHCFSSKHQLTVLVKLVQYTENSMDRLKNTFKAPFDLRNVQHISTAYIYRVVYCI
jgi:hypothetical protein